MIQIDVLANQVVNDVQRKNNFMKDVVQKNYHKVNNYMKKI